LKDGEATMAKKNTQFGITVTENKDGSYAVHFEGMTVGKVMTIQNALQEHYAHSSLCGDLAIPLGYRIKATPSLAKQL
jgi:hypothetical protein